MLCTIISTTMPASARSSNVWAASPGMSGRPTNVTRACDWSRSIALDDSFSMRCRRASNSAAFDLAAGRAISPPALPSAGRHVELEGLVNRAQGLLGVLAGHEHRNLDLAGGDHLDIDALVGQGAEHRAGHARLRGHAQPDHGNLRHILVVGVALGAEFLDGLVDGPQRAGQIVAEDGEGEIGAPVGRLVLHDHVQGDVLGRHFGEDAQRGAGPVGNAQDRDAGLVFGHRRAADRHVRRLRLAHDHRARVVAEAAADVDGHVELLGELDRAVVHHARPRRGQLEHLVVADLLDLPGLGHNAGIGRIDAVDVGVDLAGIGMEHCRQGHRRRVAAAAAQGGDVVRLVDALKARRNHDVPLSSALRIRSVEMERMRALVWMLSVMMPIWAPVRLIAWWPSE